MRLMESIRRKGGLWLLIFLGFFLVSIFAGLGVGMFSFRSCDQLKPTQTQAQTGQTFMVNDGDWKDVAMEVNGKPVSMDRYQTMLKRVEEAARGQGDDDPAIVLQAYGFAADALVREETLMAKGEELGVKVTADDLNEAKSQAIARFMNPEKSSSGNIIGDLAKSLGSARERKDAFDRYLQANALTDQMWQEQARRELFMRNTRDALQSAADEKKKERAEEKKAEIDKKLADGEDFTELARVYSDDPSAKNGGDVGTWVQRGLLFDEDIENKLFDTPVDGVTDWFTIPAGYQRFKVYDKIDAKGPEFEAKRDEIIKQIQEDKGEDYKPSDEEIAKKYEKIKFYQILLTTTDQGAAQRDAQDLVDSADVQFNDPMVLANQALQGEKIQPPASVSYDDLVTLAKNSAATKDYDFGLIQNLLDKGRPKKAEAAADISPGDAADKSKDETAPENGDESAAKDAGSTDGSADTTAKDATNPPADPKGDEPPADPKSDDKAAAADEGEVPDLGFPDQETKKPDKPVPVYALAIGLFKVGIQTDDKQGATVNNYLIGKTDLDWLDNKDQAEEQPLDRQKAREEAEDNLARAVDTYNYNPLVYAYRGLNLAWLDKKDEAKEQLDKAQNYAPQKTGEVWDTIRKAYEVLDDQDKLKQIDDLIAAMRQKQLKEAIEKAQQQQQAKSGSASTDLGNMTVKNTGGGEGETSGKADAGNAGTEGGGSDNAAPKPGGSEGSADGGKSDGGEAPPQGDAQGEG